jgi:PAS domain S-box-containing protein
VTVPADTTEAYRRLEERLGLFSEAMRAFTNVSAESQELFDAIARRVGEGVKACCGVLLLEEAGRTLVLVAAFDPDSRADPQLRPAPSPSFVVEDYPALHQVAESGEPYYAPRLDLGDLGPSLTAALLFDVAREVEFHSLLVVPLGIHGRSIGQLVVARYPPESPAFDEHDLAFARNLAGHAALAVANARLLVEARRETAERKRITERFRILAEASAEFSAETYDHNRLLDVVACRLGQLFGDMCVIRPVTEDGKWLDSTGAAYHRDPDLLAATREVMLSGRQRVGEGVSGRVAATGRALLTPQIDPADFVASSEPRYRSFLERLAVTSSMTLPLMSRGKVVGVANLMRSGLDHPYTEDDLHLVQRVAEHAALAIANARSYAAERKARDAAEEAAVDLRKAESRFARLSDSGIIGILVSDLAGHLLEINDALLELVGYSREELLSGRLAWKDLTPSGWSEVDDRAVRQLTASGIGSLREKEYLRKDGTRIPVLVGSAMLEGEAQECISFVLDLTERKATQAVIERLREERAADEKAEQQRVSLAAIVEASDDAIVGKTLDGVITSWNPGAERMFGYTADDIVGNSVSLLVPPGFEHEERTILEHLAKGEGRQLDTVRRRKDGRDIDVSMTISPVRDASGRVVGISKVARDITDRRRAEEALGRAKTAAEAASRELEAFSYSVAHDLRAPLRGMNGFAQALLDDYGEQLDAEGRDFLNEIRSNAQKMGALIDALLSLSRVTRSDWRPERVDLSALVRMVAAENAAAEPERPVRIVVEEGLSAFVDPPLARALFENLIGNAWKFTGHVPAPHIEFGTSHSDGALFLRDNGAGFDMAHANKLFAPFQRLHTVSEFAGTGIGLATVQRVVHRHGGRIWAEGKVGEGATFYFTLPGTSSGAS